MKFVLGLLLGLIIGVAGTYWFTGDEKKAEVRAEDTQNQLSRYGVVIKEKARDAGAAIADATADGRATTAIKSKLATELGGSTLTSISVSTSDGIVTLAGTVASQAEITNAVNIAYSTEGVRRVYSTLQVKGAK